MNKAWGQSGNDDMNTDFIITVDADASEPIRLMIEKIIPLDNRYFFSILNMNNGNVMFGEYLGQLSDISEDSRAVICQAIKQGDSRITFADSYLYDDLYELRDMLTPFFDEFDF